MYAEFDLASSSLEYVHVDKAELLLNLLHSLCSSLAEDFRRELISVRLLDQNISLTTSLRDDLILIAGHVRFIFLLVTATSDCEFGFAFNLDRIELYRFLGRLSTNKFFAKVFTFSFLLPLLLFPLFVFELLDHKAAPCPKACPVEHLCEEQIDRHATMVSQEGLFSLLFIQFLFTLVLHLKCEFCELVLCRKLVHSHHPAEP